LQVEEKLGGCNAGMAGCDWQLNQRLIIAGRNTYFLARTALSASQNSMAVPAFYATPSHCHLSTEKMRKRGTISDVSSQLNLSLRF
jgi:hypothetical protein